MSCKVLKLKGCEIKGSTFSGRTFIFQNRDISADAFLLKVKLRRSVIMEIQGIKEENTVYFPFSNLENLCEDLYFLEFWANLASIGNEMIAFEEFTVSSKPCECCNQAETNFSIDLSPTQIDFSVEQTIIQVGDFRMSDEQIKTAYERNSNTNAFTDTEKTKLQTLQQKNYREIVGYVNQNDTDNPVLTIVNSDFDPDVNPLVFVRNITGTYSLTIQGFIFDIDKVFFPSGLTVNENHPQFGVVESYFVIRLESSFESTLVFSHNVISIYNGETGTRYDNVSNMPFNLKIYFPI